MTPPSCRAEDIARQCFAIFEMLGELYGADCKQSLGAGVGPPEVINWPEGSPPSANDLGAIDNALRFGAYQMGQTTAVVMPPALDIIYDLFVERHGCMGGYWLDHVWTGIVVKSDRGIITWCPA
jgi:hypothetical protein